MAGERRAREGTSGIPAAELVRLLEARHGIEAEETSESGCVVARGGGRTVTVALVSGRWCRAHTSYDGRRALAPLYPAGREASVARSIAAELIEARARAVE
ncbi:hypothetical protein [Nocardiopsis synnemataformans]|uniref:hypothetical protein n=1 Tax=Nocardiopsis synnemataformans TaxID=61305 RepID=UPI003EBF0A15